MELVHRQAGEGVRLTENDAAGVQVRRVHDGFAILPFPLELPVPEGGVKAVIGVAGDEPHPNFGALREEAGPQIPPLFADNVHQTAVGGLALRI